MVNLKKFEIIQKKVVSHTEWQTRPKLIFLTFSANEEQKNVLSFNIDFKLWCFREQYTYVFHNMSRIVELCWFRKDPHRMCPFCARYCWVSVLGSLTILVAIA